MKIVRAGYEILTDIRGNELKAIERIARVCYKSEDKITEDNLSAEKLVKNLIKNGHEAMLEHGYLSIKFICDRAISHELVRHRMAAFAQESQRYCNYSQDKFDSQISVIMPWWMNEDKEDLAFCTWFDACEQAEKAYFDLLDRGYSPQQARMVLPNCTKTEIVVTANYREWRHILSLRTAPDAHPDMRELMTRLLYDLHWKFPILFDDIPVPKVGEEDGAK